MSEYDPELEHRIQLAESRRAQRGDDDTLHDPIEDDPATRRLVRRAEKQASAEVGAPGMGICHAVWGRMKEILKDQHGIDCYSPAEMNPDACFD